MSLPINVIDEMLRKYFCPQQPQQTHHLECQTCGWIGPKDALITYHYDINCKDDNIACPVCISTNFLELD